jgi:DNA-binding transcriptional LysR family regulator
MYRAEYPEVALSLHEISSASQIDALRSRVIDLGVLREPLAEGGILSEVFFREPFVTVLPSRHPLVSRRTLSLRSLSGEPFIHFPREVAPGLYDRMRSIFFQTGFAPPVVQEATEWVTVVALVEAGLGVSLVPASFRKLRWGSVVYRPLKSVDALTEVALCRRHDETSPTVRRFIELAHAQCGVK